MLDEFEAVRTMELDQAMRDDARDKGEGWGSMPVRSH